MIEQPGRPLHPTLSPCAPHARPSIRISFPKPCCGKGGTGVLEKLKRADIPQELVLGWPRSVLLGDEKLIVEQHQGIFACTETEVALKTLCGLLVISGERLSLSRYDRDGLVVFGKIEKLCYRPKG